MAKIRVSGNRFLNSFPLLGTALHFVFNQGLFSEGFIEFWHMLPFLELGHPFLEWFPAWLFAWNCLFYSCPCAIGLLPNIRHNSLWWCWIKVSRISGGITAWDYLKISIIFDYIPESFSEDLSMIPACPQKQVLASFQVALSTWLICFLNPHLWPMYFKIIEAKILILILLITQLLPQSATKSRACKL